MREREKEVQRSLGETLRERDKEREQHRREEAVQQFKALLVDLVCIIHYLSPNMEKLGSPKIIHNRLDYMNLNGLRNCVLLALMSREHNFCINS